jgi:hypothetical protein
MKAALDSFASLGLSPNEAQEMFLARAQGYSTQLEIDIARENVKESFRHVPRGSYGITCQLMLAALRERRRQLESSARREAQW